MCLIASNNEIILIFRRGISTRLVKLRAFSNHDVAISMYQRRLIIAGSAPIFRFLLDSTSKPTRITRMQHSLPRLNAAFVSRAGRPTAPDSDHRSAALSQLAPRLAK